MNEDGTVLVKFAMNHNHRPPRLSWDVYWDGGLVAAFSGFRARARAVRLANRIADSIQFGGFVRRYRLPQKKRR